jgi:hypothetical protein
MERAAVENRLRAAAFVAADAGLTDDEILAVIADGVRQARAQAAGRAETAEALATYQERFGHAA